MVLDRFFDNATGKVTSAFQEDELPEDMVRDRIRVKGTKLMGLGIQVKPEDDNAFIPENDMLSKESIDREDEMDSLFTDGLPSISGMKKMTKKAEANGAADKTRITRSKAQLGSLGQHLLDQATPEDGIASILQRSPISVPTCRGSDKHILHVEEKPFDCINYEQYPGNQNLLQHPPINKSAYSRTPHSKPDIYCQSIAGNLHNTAARIPKGSQRGPLKRSKAVVAYQCSQTSSFFTLIFFI
ncbi:hypothetical protein K469DRAFT_692891 [Zopfia rhizophila CBS 207.26]|uniref:Uncharacterized protein n=1 Tax=Zopfia rhizophila CBS 207.26 TaxID=1314779 RepID=A0A6A6DLG3_9PEZI|nr:hypothetical protein K469DRAFT_692891 [Zopfia rhizophila CBS 207.26]